MKVDRSRSLWPTAAGAVALLSLYDASARHAFAFEACAHCAATPGAIEVKDQMTAPRVDIREWPTPTRGTQVFHRPHPQNETDKGAVRSSTSIAPGVAAQWAQASNAKAWRALAS